MNALEERLLLEQYAVTPPASLLSLKEDVKDKYWRKRTLEILRITKPTDNARSTNSRILRAVEP